MSGKDNKQTELENHVIKYHPQFFEDKDYAADFDIDDFLTDFCTDLEGHSLTDAVKNNYLETITDFFSDIVSESVIVWMSIYSEGIKREQRSHFSLVADNISSAASKFIKGVSFIYFETGISESTPQDKINARKQELARASRLLNYGTYKEQLLDYWEEYYTLAPYMWELINTKDEYSDLAPMQFETLLFDGEGQLDPEHPFTQMLEKARAAYNKDIAQHLRPKSHFKPAKSVLYPIDKVNSVIWTQLSKADPNGQFGFTNVNIKVEKGRNAKRTKKEINILYSISFEALSDNLKISKTLTSIDKRVYIAVGALFNAGNDIITLRQIHYAMGNTSDPSQRQLENIDKSVTKMLKAQIEINNIQEIEANYDYPSFKYGGSLLPLEWIEATINGKLVDKALHLLREPPVISFARDRKQITTIDVKLLQSPLNKTETNLAIDDYLLERISREKRKTRKEKRITTILLKTLYEEVGLKDRKQIQRAPEKIKTYLDYYCECKFIKSYELTKDKISFDI